MLEVRSRCLLACVVSDDKPSVVKSSFPACVFFFLWPLLSFSSLPSVSLFPATSDSKKAADGHRAEEEEAGGVMPS